MRASYLGVLALVAACGDNTGIKTGAGFEVQAWPAEAGALREGITGTALDDLWSVFWGPPYTGTKLGLYHHDGFDWRDVPLVVNGEDLRPYTIAPVARGVAYVAAGALSDPTVRLLRVTLPDLVEDVTAELALPALPVTLSVRGSHGAAIASVELDGGGTAIYGLPGAGPIVRLADPPVLFEDNRILMVAGPGDAYFVAARPDGAQICHLHDGIWDTVPFFAWSGIVGRSTSASDVWFAAPGAAFGVHGDGTTWMDYSIAQLPGDLYNQAGHIMLGSGKLGIVASRVTDVDRDGSIHLLRLDDQQRYVGEELVATGSCGQPACVVAQSVAVLDDDSLVILGPANDDTRFVWTSPAR